MAMQLLPCVLLFAGLAMACAAGDSADEFTVSAWRAGEFPEQQLPEVQSRDNIALCFSGGGMRAFSSSLGFLAGLHKLGLVNRSRYITGISGGSWASGLFSVYKRGSPGVADTDDDFLGPIPSPSELTPEFLANMSHTSGRRVPTQSVIKRIAELLAARHTPFDQVWRDAVSSVVLEPFGVDPEAGWALDADHVKDIRARNPALVNASFTVMNKHRPFPVLGISLLAPLDVLPTSKQHRAYTLLEATPLYVGESHAMNVSYVHGGAADNSTHNKTETVLVGGNVETFAMGSDAPAAGLPPHALSGLVSVPRPPRLYSAADALGASSFAPGAVFSLLPVIGSRLEMNLQYWSPEAPAPTARPMALGDGGDFENIHVIGMLKRGVKSLLVFCNFELPVQPDWDPTQQPPSTSDIDDDVPALFGAQTDDPASYLLTKNQVFRKEDFPRVALALQAAQARGKGIVATTELETVANSWWGIPAGRLVNVTWVYLGRAPVWEAALPPATRADVVPKTDPANLANTIDKGPYKNFPHYETFKQLHLQVPQINLLADLCGWIIEQNADTIRAAFDAARE